MDFLYIYKGLSIDKAHCWCVLLIDFEFALKEKDTCNDLRQAYVRVDGEQNMFLYFLDENIW